MNTKLILFLVNISVIALGFLLLGMGFYYTQPEPKYESTIIKKTQFIEPQAVALDVSVFGSVTIEEPEEVVFSTQAYVNLFDIPQDTLGKEHWDSRVRHHCTLRNLDCERVLRIMYCESGGRANAYNTSSRASGLFQQLQTYWPARAAQYGVPGASPFDGEANIIVSLGMMENGMFNHWVCK